MDEATSRGDFNLRAEWCLELAKVHAALAYVAATAYASDAWDWVKVADSQLCDMTLALREQDRT